MRRPNVRVEGCQREAGTKTSGTALLWFDSTTRKRKTDVVDRNSVGGPIKLRSGRSWAISAMGLMLRSRRELRKETRRFSTTQYEIRSPIRSLSVPRGVWQRLSSTSSVPVSRACGTYLTLSLSVSSGSVVALEALLEGFVRNKSQGSCENHVYLGCTQA